MFVFMCVVYLEKVCILVYIYTQIIWLCYKEESIKQLNSRDIYRNTYIFDIFDIYEWVMFVNA